MIDESDGEYRIVETSAIPTLSQVHIYDETLPHLGQGHPEMRLLLPSLEHAIDDTIANPTEIRRSNVELHTDSFKYCSTNHKMGNNHLVVPIKRIEGDLWIIQDCILH